MLSPQLGISSGGNGMRLSTISALLAHVGSCLLLVAPVSADYPSILLEDNPLGFWRLNETTGTVAANLGTLGMTADGQFQRGEKGVQGPNFLADETPLKGMGHNNRGFAVGAEGSFVSIADSPVNNVQEFTISAWVNPTTFNASRLGILGQNDVIELGFIEPNRLHLNTGTGGSVSYTIPPDSDTVQPSNWFHVAATGNGQSLSLYINGDPVAQGGKPTGGSYGQSNFPLQVGGGGIFDPTGNQLRGTMANIAVWDQAVPADRLKLHVTVAIGDAELGDFDFDGDFDEKDVNLLSRAIYEESLDALYDLSGNGYADEDDLTVWVQVVKATFLGDANLDGEFTTSDFVHVFLAGEYEDAIPLNSGWEEGDWNADLDFTSADFTAAFLDGGFEVGPFQPPNAAVPEPSSGLLFGLSLLSLLPFVHRRTGIEVERD